MNSVYEATVQLNEAIALVEILFFDKVTSNFFSRIEGYFTQQFSVSFGPKKGEEFLNFWCRFVTRQIATALT